MEYDYLIVGAGFAGSVLAERLASAGQCVLLVDRRNHVGGNAFDYIDAAGIRVHRYGPHVFHTNSTRVFQYLSRFTAWRKYEHRVLACVEGQFVPMPVNVDTVNRLLGYNLTLPDFSAYLARVCERRMPVRTAEDVVVNRIGYELFERLFRNYTKKQWGVESSALDASVTARLPVRFSHDTRYFTDRYQAMPVDGFTALFSKMVSHPRIDLALGVDYRTLSCSTRYRTLVYTGAVDELFDYRFGRLPYRSLRFRHETLDREQYQPVAVINFPNDYDYTRITEYKHLTGQRHERTSIAFEYPQAEGEPFYPVLTAESRECYERYRGLASCTPGLILAGRLATFQYLNMDQVAAQALALARRLLTRTQVVADVYRMPC